MWFAYNRLVAHANATGTGTHVFRLTSLTLDNLFEAIFPCGHIVLMVVSKHRHVLFSPCCSLRVHSSLFLEAVIDLSIDGFAHVVSSRQVSSQHFLQLALKV